VVDFGVAAADYARYRQGFPADFFRRLEPFGIGAKASRVLDLGTGTGLLARAFARRGCHVVGLDPSASLLEEARKADRAAGLMITHVQARAEATGLASASFDLVSAATCWHWFDRQAAAREAARLLAPGGLLLIAALDWQRFPGNVIETTLDVLDRYAPPAPSSRPHSFLYPEWTTDLSPAGFRGWDVFSYTTTLHYTHEAWRGRVRASAGAGPAMDRPTLAAFDAELASALTERHPDSTLAVDHRIFALIAWIDRSG
jgi:SAM-dependent methyltransferase